jgi:hypothetical protein
VRAALDGYADVFTGSFELVAYVDAWFSNLPTRANLPIVGGTIEYTLDADVQATLHLTVVDSDGTLVPRRAGDILAPYGQELAVSMGANVSGQPVTDNPIPIGWFRIQQPTAHEKWLRTPPPAAATGTLAVTAGFTGGLLDTLGRPSAALPAKPVDVARGWRHGGAVIEVVGLDRMAILADARFLTMSQPPVGATVFSEIARLVGDLVPLAGFDAALVDVTVPSGVVYQDDRVAALKALAAAVGGVLRFDAGGALRVAVPTPYGAVPVHTFTVGEAGDVVDYETTMTRDGITNAVVATGEASTDHAPLMAIAYDTDLGSPSRWGGPFGRVPEFFSSPLLTTAARAAAAARALLANERRGREREHTVQVVPNFLLELDDPAQIVLPDRMITGRIVKMALPLTPGLMSVTVRALDTADVLIDITVDLS